jgi:bacterioferritin-associated ferredoxin
LHLQLILISIWIGEPFLMYVCLCHGIRDRELQQAVEQGASSFEELQARTGVAGGCRTCEPTAREFLDSALASRDAAIQAA